MMDISEWALNLPDEARVHQRLVWYSPDGRQFMAPVGTPLPNMDLPLSSVWVEIRFVRPGEDR